MELVKLLRYFVILTMLHAFALHLIININNNFIK